MDRRLIWLLVLLGGGEDGARLSAVAQKKQALDRLIAQ